MKSLSSNTEVMAIYPCPKRGEKLRINVTGKPPFKDGSFSIRNPKHKIYRRFVKLRQNAIKVMKGRKWYEYPSPIQLKLTYFMRILDRSLGDYDQGIMDTLGGSHGYSFTCLPIIYQDDNQVHEVHSQYVKARSERYSIEVVFL